MTMEAVVRARMSVVGAATVAILLGTMGAVPGATPSAAAVTRVTATGTPVTVTNPVWGPLTGADDLGRSLPTSVTAGAPRGGKYVGVFYQLWHGSNDSRDYKNIVNLQSVLDANPAAPNDTTSPAFPDAGHFAYWGQPLFGYYRSDDYWVIVKQLEMLSDAGVDFLEVDASNGRDFKPQVNLLMQAIEDLQRAGRAAPQLVLLTHNNSTVLMDDIYATFYAPTAPYRHPTTWFQYKGKPVIVGVNPSVTVSSFFTVRYAQWPNEAKQSSNGWDWISFDSTPRVNLNSAGEKEEVAVGVAANSNAPSYAFSEADYYGASGARGRGYHAGVDDASTSAINGGAYFQQQWTQAIAADPSIIVVDGWNEWAAGNWQKSDRSDHLAFYDSSSLRYSRDIEPMQGGYGDNFYLQLASNVSTFKGVAAAVAPSAATSISVGGAFGQWNTVSPTYLGYGSLAGTRNHAGTSTAVYQNTSARNVFSFAKVARDATNLYFMVQTERDITASSGGKWMTLFLDTDGNAADGWNGYEYAINRTGVGATTTTLEKNAGGYTWSTVSSSISYQVSGNQLMLAVPRSLIGASTDPVNVSFKWADNWNTDGTVTDFYQYGDTVPYGRMSYLYSTNSGLPAYSAPSVPAPGAKPVLSDGSHLIQNDDLLTEYNDYSGSSSSWNTSVAAPAASGGSIATLASNNGSTDPYYINTVSTVFTGDAVSWITRRAPDGVRQAEVFIDGASYGTVSLYRASTQDNWTAFHVAGLPSGPHSIEITCANVLGQTCYHDAFQYSRGAASVAAGTLGEDLANGAAVTSSSAAAARYYSVGAAMTRDLNAHSEWRAADGGAQWLEYDFGRTQALDRMELTPGSTGFSPVGFQVQTWNGSAWGSIASGTLGASTVLTTFAKQTVDRLRVTFNAVSGNAVSVAEARISNGDADVTAGKSVTTSSANPGYPGSNAVDGNDTTYWCASSGAMPQSLTVDLGAVANWAQTKIVFYASDTWRYRLEGSNDNATWSTVSDFTTSGFTGQTNVDTPGVQYRYARITVTGAAANWAAIRTFQILGSVIGSGTDQALGKAATSSSNSTGSEAAKAVDGTDSTWWCASSAVMPQWISVDLGSQLPLRSIVLTFYGPDVWQYWTQVSNDGTTWRTVASRANQSGQVYADSVSGSYRYVRVQVRSAAANWAAIRTLQVLGG